MAVTALEAAGITWEEAFFSPGLAAVRSAIEAGLGIGCLGRSVSPSGIRVLGRADGLPDLPESELALLTRTADGGLRRILATLGDELAAEAAGGTE
jgi:DNA-binding transcriptional LysR family regulator